MVTLQSEICIVQSWGEFSEIIHGKLSAVPGIQLVLNACDVSIRSRPPTLQREVFFTRYPYISLFFLTRITYNSIDNIHLHARHCARHLTFTNFSLICEKDTVISWCISGKFPFSFYQLCDMPVRVSITYQWKFRLFVFKTKIRKFPGGPVVKSHCFHCHGPGFDSWSGR